MWRRKKRNKEMEENVLDLKKEVIDILTKEPEIRNLERS